MSYHASNYVCGCSYFPSNAHVLTYLPLAASESHTSVLSSTYRTKLEQVFTNPTAHAIPECTYGFPLFDGVAVVAFTCHVGSRTLHGVVKERNVAKAVYDAAVARGETAGLMEQLPEASDVFTTKLGNIPSGQTVTVEIEYVGELKQDADANGMRFTIPTKIAPRYGTVAGSKPGISVGSSSMKIVVDAEMPTGSNIQGIESPSHPIAITLGRKSMETDAECSMSKASARLSLTSTHLDKDFVLIILAKDTGTPRAVLETHPTIPNQRALMVTLVPKFSLPPSRPEIVFVVDRSGSMAGNIPIVISAMKVFLKSLPLGVKFNICSFGSSHEFLWPQSKSYAQDTLSEATSYVDRFGANMGGTETFRAVKATIDQRFKDIPLEVMLLTDGDIWQQNDMFSYLNEAVEKSKGDIRVFPLGIGHGVSHALIEGIARAGNGFGQSVQDGEKLDNRLVRMLKGALSPHITDYSLEVKYEVKGEAEEGFEMVEKSDKVTDGFKVTTTEVEVPEEPKQKAPISLFDENADHAEEDRATSQNKSGQDRYANVPLISSPKLLQAPHKIPTLFSFTRTSVYLLMSPEASPQNPTSVILRGTSLKGPLELEIPVHVVPEPAETIHQLAVKKAVQDLEEGRGWLYDARDENNVLIKERYPSNFEEMIQREAVRLGTTFGIAGKWTSFVALADNDKDNLSEVLEDLKTTRNYDLPGSVQSIRRPSALGLVAAGGGNLFSLFRTPPAYSAPYVQQTSGVQQVLSVGTKSARGVAPQGSGSQRRSIFRSSSSIASASPPPPAPFGFGGMSANIGFGATGGTSPSTFVGTRSRGPPTSSQSFGGGLFGSGNDRGEIVDGQNHLVQQSAQSIMAMNHSAPAVRKSKTTSFGAKKRSARSSQSVESECNNEESKVMDWSGATDEAIVHRLITLQSFEGYWEWVEELKEVLRPDMKISVDSSVDGKVSTTVLVVMFLERTMKAERGIWELVVEKAKTWLEGVVGEEDLKRTEQWMAEVVAVRSA